MLFCAISEMRCTWWEDWPNLGQSLWMKPANRLFMTPLTAGRKMHLRILTNLGTWEASATQPV